MSFGDGVISWAIYNMMNDRGQRKVSIESCSGGKFLMAPIEASERVAPYLLASVSTSLVVWIACVLILFCAENFAPGKPAHQFHWLVQIVGGESFATVMPQKILRFFEE